MYEGFIKYLTTSVAECLALRILDEEDLRLIPGRTNFGIDLFQIGSGLCV